MDNITISIDKEAAMTYLDKKEVAQMWHCTPLTADTRLKDIAKECKWFKYEKVGKKMLVSLLAILKYETQEN